ncbi:ictacalcin isoform X1 [Oryzias latipes]|uniref:Ictacalcin n=2 Tax=Oryzias latipes TaxID=8090 RepID=A0A3B3I3T3_ORYLA|nr:ictacalcin isoform X1 [Oryzias latipes]
MSTPHYSSAEPNPAFTWGMSSTMSDIQKAMALLITSFSKYAGREGDKNTLSKEELKELLQTEFGDMVCKSDDKEAIDRIFRDLDTNQSNSVDFSEFVKLVCCLTQMCHEFFTGRK